MNADRREHRYSVTTDDGRATVITATPGDLAARVGEWRAQEGCTGERLTIIDETACADWVQS